MLHSSLAVVLKFVAAVLVVSIHPAYSAMTRVPLGLLTLARRSDRRQAPSQAQCWPTKLQPNKPGYQDRCGAVSDPKHPCLTQWNGDLSHVQARPYLEPLAIERTLFIKDENMLDFSMDKPEDAFIVTYLDGGNTQLIYSGYDQQSGCYNITLRGGQDDPRWRIWVSDDKGNDRDVDTRHHPETTQTLCTKWMHVHVKKDGGSNY
ncbi:hypothetical protein EX895_005884 [Sporisorium graminicola]|uniref:Mig1 protein n=1 Tax=Sporisorium graminicola TaxID=280036 RepID=A0A4U7KL92_9BASI|nr:hypothetical protein EX895_005884 [Sporisorium graminicola]TKY84804.1 hypothetical protein EX895_005884 [Sporisorium graminicola]